MTAANVCQPHRLGSKLSRLFELVSSFCTGASGAGKTTFMDVIAGRKNQGRITGDIRVNGHPQARLLVTLCPCEVMSSIKPFHQNNQCALLFRRGCSPP